MPKIPIAETHPSVVLSERQMLQAMGRGDSGPDHQVQLFTTKRLPRLPDDLASTFRGGRYATVKLEKDTILYRVGTMDRPLGQFFSRNPPASEIQSRIDQAILPQWPWGRHIPIRHCVQGQDP